MKMQEILTAAGANKRRKRIGRGRSSGMGKTSGRGHKGFGQRSGSKSRGSFEGGQNPMLRRIPKRGFNNYNFAEAVEIVNLCDLERVFVDGDTVDVATLAEKRLINRTDVTVKLLGKGELTRKLNITVTRASASVAEKIAAVGGKLELTGK